MKRTPLLYGLIAVSVISCSEHVDVEQATQWKDQQRRELKAVAPSTAASVDSPPPLVPGLAQLHDPFHPAQK